MTYLHVGCGPHKLDGFINTDTDLDITQPLPYDTDEVDGITSMHVLIELNHRQILSFFREARRVLKPSGVLRFGVPHIHSGFNIDFLLGWGNITLLSEEVLEFMLKQAGFTIVKRCKYRETISDHPLIVEADNRPNETLYMEAFL